MPNAAEAIETARNAAAASETAAIIDEVVRPSIEDMMETALEEIRTSHPVAATPAAPAAEVVRITPITDQQKAAAIVAIAQRESYKASLKATQALLDASENSLEALLVAHGNFDVTMPDGRNISLTLSRPTRESVSLGKIKEWSHALYLFLRRMGFISTTTYNKMNINEIRATGTAAANRRARRAPVASQEAAAPAAPAADQGEGDANDPHRA